MSLVPDTIVSLAEDDTIGGGKNIVAGASVNITKSTGGSASIFSDAAGTSAISLPTVTNSNGELKFWIAPGLYIYTVAGENYNVNISEKNDFVVETFADLATTPVTAPGMIVYTKQHTSGGIGGGHFQDTAGTITNNGGTLINNAVTAGRHWKRINYDFLTPEMFGVIGDGATDDTTAIDLALALGKKVYGRSGAIYLVSGVSSSAPIYLFGDRTMTLKLANSSNNPVITLTAGADGSVISGFVIDGNKANNTTPGGSGNMGVAVQGPSKVKVTNCLIKDCYTHGVELGTSSDSIVESNEFTGINASAVRIYSNATSSRRNKIRFNDIGQCTSGIFLDSLNNSSISYDNDVSYNYINGILGTAEASAADGGIAGHRCYRTKVIGNTVINSAGRGIHLFYKTFGSIISKNTVSNTGTTNVVGAIDIGDMSEDYGLVISDNSISDNYGPGLYLTGVYRSAITGNTIINNGLGSPAELRLKSCILINDPSGTGFYDDGTPVSPGTNPIADNVFCNNVLYGGRHAVAALTGGASSYLRNAWTNNTMQGQSDSRLNIIGVTDRFSANPGLNPVGGSTITVGASPFTYTNNDNAVEMVSVYGGTVSNVVSGGVSVATNTNTQVTLEPGEAVAVTYSSVPQMAKFIK